MSDNTTKVCGDCKETLPVWEFYVSSRHADGFFTYCKSCHRRRASDSVNRIRAEKRVVQYEGAGDKYLQRHEAKRLMEQQALECLSEPSPKHNEVLGFISTESEFEVCVVPFGIEGYTKRFLRSGNKKLSNENQNHIYQT